MKKINEFFTITNGFFTTLKETNPTKYSELFDSYEPTDLEIDFLSICGERYASPVVIYSDDMTTLTRVILNRYENAWTKIKSALFADYEITNPYNIITENTTETEGSSTNETENQNAYKTYGYDSETAINKDDTLETGTNNTKNKNLTSIISKSRGNNGATSYPELIQAEIETRKITFLTLIMNDIKEFVTLKIY